MAKLIHTFEGSVISEFVLYKELVTIGRKAQNDIKIENRNASSEHARIVTLGNDCFLEDIGSTNGTRVNGKPINKHVLQHNDLIEIGGHRFQFIGDANQPADNDFEKTIVLRASAAVPRVAPQQLRVFTKLKSWFRLLLSG